MHERHKRHIFLVLSLIFFLFNPVFWGENKNKKIEPEKRTKKKETILTPCTELRIRCSVENSSALCVSNRRLIHTFKFFFLFDVPTI